ncbi:Ubiquitin fusion degradation protein-2, partial [Pseudoloma neurophilia]
SYVKFHEYAVELDNNLMDLREFREELESDPRYLAQRDMLSSKLQAVTFHVSAKIFKEHEEPFVDFMINLALEKGVKNFPSLYFDIVLKLKTEYQRYYDDEISPSLMDFIENLFDLSNRNVNFQSDIISVLRIDNIWLTLKLFNQLIIFYSDLNQFPEFINEKYSLRYKIHEIFLTDTSSQFQNMEPTKENLRFVSFMLDDFQERLNAGLSAIADIKRLSEELDNCKNFKRKKEIHKLLKRAKRQARPSFEFVMSSYRILFTLADETNLLLRSEILKKFISILNCNLKTIVGPKCSNLAIKSPEKYGFFPKEFLAKILRIYLTMDNEKYLQTIVSDLSYFNIQLFKKCLYLIDSKGIFNKNEESEDFKLFVNKLEKIQKDTIEDDDIVPDEFIDPITCDVMEDPVLLKTSKVIIDRTTFDSLMLSDRIDPFNREILDDSKIEAVTELKQKIEKYWADKKMKRAIE